MNPPAKDDLELVKEFLAGNERGFNELVLKHRRAVFAVIAGIVGNRDDAEDLTQDAFIKAYTSLAGFRGDSAFSTWLYRIAVNIALNHVRTRKFRSFFGLDSISATMPASERSDEAAERGELSRKAAQAVSKLPPKQRAVFILRHFHEMTHAQIAEIMDRDEGTIKANYFQAVRKLRISLGPYTSGKE